MNGTFYFKKNKKKATDVLINRQKENKNFYKKIFYFLDQKNPKISLEEKENLKKESNFEKVRDKNIKILMNRKLLKKIRRKKYVDTITFRQKIIFYSFFRPLGRRKIYKKKTLSLKVFRNFFLGNNWTFSFSDIIKFKFQKFLFF